MTFYVVKMLCVLCFQLFSGNKNTHIAVLSDVKPPIIASRVRFIPHSRYKRTVCMRVEVYGCPWKGRTYTDILQSCL